MALHVCSYFDITEHTHEVPAVIYFVCVCACVRVFPSNYLLTLLLKLILVFDIRGQIKKSLPIFYYW